ncbi:hypothetical protein KBC51_03390 [Candidatus Saccharibacteria bacterium]|nr:hypothetical protein [Candidatus Saccharibacteria bacterium]
MDSIKDLLLAKNLEEPTELAALKSFCLNNYKFEAKIKITNDSITLFVPNGILATELRMQQKTIINRCQLTKKLHVRIG